MAGNMNLEEWIGFSQEEVKRCVWEGGLYSCDTVNEQRTDVRKCSGMAKRTGRSLFLTWRLHHSGSIQGRKISAAISTVRS